MHNRCVFTVAILVGLLGIVLVHSPLNAHCDTMDGPVVTDAKLALEKGDVTPVLKWVKKESEAEIRQAFQKTLVVRGKGPEAKELADMYFFETLVRVHRASEGEPYTGLKPAGTPIDPAVREADQALANGSIDELIKKVTAHVEHGVRERFVRALKAKKHANESVEMGREYVEAYVAYVHYLENIHLAAAGTATHGE